MYFFAPWLSFGYSLLLNFCQPHPNRRGKSSSKRPVGIPGIKATAQLQTKLAFSKWSIIMLQPYMHIAFHNVYPSVGLFCDDAPL